MLRLARVPSDNTFYLGIRDQERSARESRELAGMIFLVEFFASIRVIRGPLVFVIRPSGFIILMIFGTATAPRRRIRRTLRLIYDALPGGSTLLFSKARWLSPPANFPADPQGLLNNRFNVSAVSGKSNGVVTKKKNDASGACHRGQFSSEKTHC